jgi:hypothetical protein
MEDGMGGPCGTCGRREMNIGLWRGKLKERDQFDDLGIYRSIILKWILKV